MTEQSRTITISLSPFLQVRLNARAAQRGASRSEYIRTLIERDLEAESLTAQVETRLGFLELGIDALLKHHPNSELRGVVHNTHRERSQRRLGQEIEG